jgi:hypothetical protein
VVQVPPIGFEPLAEACIREGRFDQAVQYANKVLPPPPDPPRLCAHLCANHRFCAQVTDQARKAELCMRMGMYREAAEAAVAARDGDMVAAIRAKVRPGPGAVGPDAVRAVLLFGEAS